MKSVPLSGMLLGKFLPPHLGHVYLVDFARHFVNDLTVVVGTLSTEPIPGNLRFEWMRSLFPTVRVVHLDEDLPQDPSEHPDFWKLWQDALLRVLPHRPDLVFASEAYGAKLAEVLGGRFLPVDPGRNIRRISGTAVRRDPYGNWDLLPTPVRSWYLKRVCVFGPESTGKSTLSQDLARALDTLTVPEYARTMLEPRSGEFEEADLLDMARGQMASEDALAPYANRILITDTDALTTTVWSQFLYQRVDEQLRALAESRTYDLYLLTDVDVPWVKDTVRILPNDRSNFLELCEKTLQAAGRPYLKLSGSWGDRFATALAACQRVLSLPPHASWNGDASS